MGDWHYGLDDALRGRAAAVNSFTGTDDGNFCFRAETRRPWAVA